MATGAAALCVNTRAPRRIARQRIGRHLAQRANVGSDVCNIFLRKKPAFRHFWRDAIAKHGFQRRVVGGINPPRPVQTGSTSSLAIHPMAKRAMALERTL